MKRVLIGLMWALSLLAVGTVARAQRAVPPGGREPEVIAGSEIGFRVDRYNGTTPVGELVVRRNGQWVAVEFGARLKATR